MLITFNEWDIDADFKVYDIQLDGFNVARLRIDNRIEYNSILTFDSRFTYKISVVTGILEAIKEKFGRIEFKIAG